MDLETSRDGGIPAEIHIYPWSPSPKEDNRELREPVQRSRMERREYNTWRWNVDQPVLGKCRQWLK